MRTKIYLIAAIIILAAVLFSRFLSAPTLEVRAANIVEECSGQSRVNACYDKEIENLTTDLPMKKSFELIKLIQQKDDGYWFCHTASHIIGSMEYKKTPGDWTGVISRCPVGICSNGCLHGVMQEHFGTEFISGSKVDEVVDAVKEVCQNKSSWNAAELQTASCYHEMGHVGFLTTGGNVELASYICDQISVVSSTENYLQTCYEGVTMSVFQPLETDDFAIVYQHVPKKDELKNCEPFEGEEKSICWRRGWKGAVAPFCDQFAGELQYACFREGWVMEGDRLESAVGIENYCAYSSDKAEKKKCYNKIFYGLVTRFEFDENKMIALCQTLPAAIKGQCFGNTASRLIETDRTLVSRATAVCNQAANSGIGEDCYKELLWYSTFAFKAGSAEFFDLCGRLPQEWKQKCLEQNK